MEELAEDDKEIDESGIKSVWYLVFLQTMHPIVNIYGQMVEM